MKTKTGCIASLCCLASLAGIVKVSSEQASTCSTSTPLIVSALANNSPPHIAALTTAEVQPARVQPAGHLKMVELLKSIRDNTNEENVYQGDRYARLLREKVAKFNPQTTLMTRIETLYDLGSAELVIGNEEAAIEALTKVYQMVPAVPTAELPKEVREKVLLTLGVSYMRLGETENCCAQESPDNCIIPISNGYDLNRSVTDCLKT